MSTHGFDVPELLRSVWRKMEQDFEAGTKQIGHRGAKGSVRELLVHDFLVDWMPRTVEVLHSGTAVSVEGGQSGQCDIVLVDPGTPPLMAMRVHHVVPVECLHGVLQIKSSLDGPALREDSRVVDSVKKMRKHALHSADKHTMAYGRTWDSFPTWCGIFGFGGSSLETLRDALEELDNDAPDAAHRIDAVFVAGEGALMSLNSDGTLSPRATRHGGRHIIRCDQHSIALMTVVMQAVMREAWMPQFRLLDYLQPTMRIIDPRIVNNDDTVYGVVDGGGADSFQSD